VVGGEQLGQRSKIRGVHRGAGEHDEGASAPHLVVQRGVGDLKGPAVTVVVGFIGTSSDSAVVRGRETRLPPWGKIIAGERNRHADCGSDVGERRGTGLARARAGDDVAFTRLVEPLQRELHALCYHGATGLESRHGRLGHARVPGQLSLAQSLLDTKFPHPLAEFESQPRSVISLGRPTQPSGGRVAPASRIAATWPITPRRSLQASPTQTPFPQPLIQLFDRCRVAPRLYTITGST